MLDRNRKVGLQPNLRSSARGNLLSQARPQAVLSPVSYRLSRRRRQRKRLLLKVPNERREHGIVF